MDGDGEIRPIGRPVFGGGHGSGGTSGGSSHDEVLPEPRPQRPPLDAVVLTEPKLATLRLLRNRVLEKTRQGLGLPRNQALGVSYAPRPQHRADVYVGRLLSEQNLLASIRRDSWSEARITDALQEGMWEGVGETLEILDELGDLDADAWGLVCSVTEEFHRKVVAVGGDVAEPPA